MYSICNVIVGAPIPKEIRRAKGFYGISLEDIGFTILYSGNADEEPGYCGVEISTFDECGTMKASDLRLVPSEQQILEATNKLAEARRLLMEWLTEEDFKDEEKNQLVNSIPEKPDVYLIWSTS
jgi:hypothetical protein